RAGWVGCNFDLTRIPAEARIVLVQTVPSPSPPRSGGEGRGEVVPIPQDAAHPPGIHKPRASVLECGGPPPLFPVGRGGRKDVRTLIVPPEEVRKKFQRLKPLKELSIQDRGWTLDVLNIVHRLGKKEFSNADVYAFERELETLHPGNRHIKDKIRQQLQQLRDRNLLLHVGRNCWRLP
ncbi:MAG TPA: hypothetical protein VH251_09510, partial [Verrucomicrobiae bacterium]|nr:hypothetical protein [Verrucomicrobiae bacterium]